MQGPCKLVAQVYCTCNPPAMYLAETVLKKAHMPQPKPRAKNPEHEIFSPKHVCIYAYT